MEKLPEHCPGPPAGQADTSSETTTDTDLGKQLRHREEELQQLRSEVESYAGKLKTFQTLGALYAESQRACSAYKAQNDDLVRQLTGLMRRMSPTSPPAARENETETAGKRGDDAEKAQQSSWLLDFTEEREKDASLSSSSVVNINSSLSDDSLRRGHHDNGVTAGAAARTTQAAGGGAAAVNAEDSTSLSADIGELTARLMEAHRQHRLVDGSSSSSSSRAVTAAALAGDGDERVSSELIVSSLAVLKLERQTRLQKAMMEQMSLKLSELDSQLALKDNTITQLQDDRARLAAEVNALRRAHETRLICRDTEPETSRETDTLAGSDQNQQSGDWVQVEKRVSSAGRVDIAAVSTAEAELKRRVDKLNSMISELVTVNRSWDEHCKQQEISHSRQMAALNAELADVRQRLDDRQKCDDERQKEFDELMLSAKKQRQDEEMAKEDALSELHVEKRRRADAEDRCVEFSRKMAELEAQVRALQTAQASNQQSSSMSSLTSNTPDRDMMLELQMLRDQVSVFKEDFDQERRDREASRTMIEHLDTKLRETNIELTTTKTKLMDALANLRSTKSENLQLKDRFQKVADDLRILQRQAATRPAPAQYVPTVSPYVRTPTYRLPAYVPTVSPTPVYTGQTQLSPAGRVWSCPTCTYENPAQRTSCEMCGRLKVAEQAVYRRDEHHHHYRQPDAAGLHDYEGAVPATRPDWLLRLPSSNLETDQDQSAHQQL